MNIGHDPLIFQRCKKSMESENMICPICNSFVDYISDVIIHTNRHYRYKLGCDNPDCPNFVGRDFWHQSKRTALNNWLYRLGRGNKYRRVKGLSDVDANTLDLFNGLT